MVVAQRPHVSVVGTGRGRQVCCSVGRVREGPQQWCVVGACGASAGQERGSGRAAALYGHCLGMRAGAGVGQGAWRCQGKRATVSGLKSEAAINMLFFWWGLWQGSRGGGAGGTASTKVDVVGWRPCCLAATSRVDNLIS